MVCLSARDYEIIGYLTGEEVDTEIQYIFKGCIKSDYQITVAPSDFSMDEILLDASLQNEPNYPKAFIWGVNYSVVYPGWILIEDTGELKELEKLYGIRFYEIQIQTNAYNLTLIFNDLETKEIKIIKQ
jgi:hypothetical protein